MRRAVLIALVALIGGALVFVLGRERDEPVEPGDGPPPAVGPGVTALALDDRHLVVGDATGEVTVRVLGEPAPPVRWVAHPGPIRAVALRGDRLLTAGAAGSVAWWRRDGRRLARQRLPDERLNDAVPLDGDAVVAGVRGTVARLGPDGVVWQQPDAHERVALAVALSPDGDRVASGGGGGRIAVWSVRDGRRLAEWPAHAGWVTGLVWDEAGLVSAGADGVVRRWDPDARSPKGTLARELGTVVALAGDGERVLAATADGSVWLWTGDGAPRRLAGPGGDWIAVTLGAGRAAAGGRDGRVAIWDRAGRRLPPPPSSP